MNVPGNIIAHMQKVAAISLFLGEKIQVEQLQYLISAALTHDIMKLQQNHEEAAANYFEKRGEFVIASQIRKHRYSSLIDQDKSLRPVTIEEKILYYADKRIMHDKIVSLEERLEDGRLRYPVPSGQIQNDQRIEKAIKTLESQLCELSNIQPNDINESLIAPYLERITKLIIEDR